MRLNNQQVNDDQSVNNFRNLDKKLETNNEMIGLAYQKSNDVDMVAQQKASN